MARVILTPLPMECQLKHRVLRMIVEAPCAQDSPGTNRPPFIFPLTPNQTSTLNLGDEFHNWVVKRVSCQYYSFGFRVGRYECISSSHWLCRRTRDNYGAVKLTKWPLAVAWHFSVPSQIMEGGFIL